MPPPLRPRSAQALGRDCDRAHPRRARSAAGRGAPEDSGGGAFGAHGHWPPLLEAGHSEGQGPGCPAAESSQARPVRPSPCARAGATWRNPRAPLADQRGASAPASGIPIPGAPRAPLPGLAVLSGPPHPRAVEQKLRLPCGPHPRASPQTPTRRPTSAVRGRLVPRGPPSRCSLSHVALSVLGRTAICPNESSFTGGETEARKGRAVR